MNKACSAGTGSYLAEQARIYGIESIEEVCELALSSERPANLGSFCTVFVSELADRARAQGYSKADVFAGFHYAVINNYIHRVMGNRKFGERVFFQGKPASSLALACALAGVSKLQVLVPDNPGAMGAVGIAFRAVEKTGISRARIPLEPYLNAHRLERAEFRCKDRECGNRCRITRELIRVGGKTRKVISGGNCPKYEFLGAVFPKLPKGAPDAFLEWTTLLEGFVRQSGNVSLPAVAIPLGLVHYRLAPFFIAFFKELGYRVKLSRTTRDTFAEGERRAACYDFCAPAKIMHGLCSEDGADYFFIPHIEELPREGNAARAYCCPIVQGMPYVIDSIICRNTRVLKPRLSFSKDWDSASVRWELLRMAAGLGKGLSTFHRAWKAGVKAQIFFQENCLEIGRRILHYAEERKIPVIVVLGRPYVLHDPVMQSQIPALISRQGCLALPADCYPFKEAPSDLTVLFWKEGLHNLRVALDTLHRQNVWTLWLTCYTCGPDAFLEHFYHYIMQDRPHTILETDGHRGEAGFATRIQAYLTGISEHQKSSAAPDNEPPLSVYNIPPQAKIAGPGTRLVFPPMGDGIIGLVAATFRSKGVLAEALSTHTSETMELGKRDASGKECLPFVMVWGALMRHLRRVASEEKIVYVVPSSCGPCRFGMYEVLMRQLLEERGIAHRVSLYSPSSKDGYGSEFGDIFRLRLWAATLYGDLLKDMLLYVRPAACEPGEAESLFMEAHQRAAAYLESLKGDGLGDFLRVWNLPDMMRKEAQRFAAVARDRAKESSLRTVAMVGEIYVRLDDFTNNFTIRHLEAHGLRVRLVGAREWIDYVAEVGARRGSLRMYMRKRLQWYIRNKLVSAASPVLNSRREHSSWRLVQEAMPYIGASIGGEADLTVGGPLFMYRKREIDGVVVLGPHGCMPTKLAEAQLSRCAPDLPSLFLYVDGDPYDVRPIESFAWRLRSRPSNLAGS